MLRRVVSLVIVAALAVAVVGVHTWFSSRTLFGVSLVATPVHRAVDGEGDVAGQHLVLRGAEWDPDDIDAPDGSRTLSVELDVTKSSEEDCSFTELQERSGVGRTWIPANDVTGDGDAVDAHSGCVGYADGPYTVRAVYVLPRDADGPFTLTFRTSGGRGGLQFDIAP